MVRGEQEGAMYHLYNMYRNLIRAYHHSDEYRSFVSSLAATASTGGSPSTGSSSRPRRILRGNGVDEDLLAADSASADADLQTDSDSIFRVDEQVPMLSWRKLQGDKHHHFRHAHSKHSGSGSHHSGSKSGSHHSGSAHKSDLDLDLAAGTSKQLLEHPAATAAGDSWAALPLGARLGLPTVKGLYESVATRRKEPWFNDLHPERAMLGVRALYTATYGYLGKDVVSGFKEIRYVRGNSFRTEASYKEFEEFMAFLSGICNDVKFVLNTRNTSDLAANIKLKEMYNRDAKFDQVFESNMRATHAWFDQFAKDHPTKAIRVLMEDMFDAERSPDLARRLVSFLGADPDQNPIRFDRMPTCVGSC
ncbi:hypothetical protein HYH03_010380 [Edaphochlamys debaryana]|uniref:Uncharacterized protein n=1 Tax=Edaphochlamys debaryana TaxID=47281 RepID=A0A835XY48_9CHLO|nr:hypothetical protein HYH03_010380 [Edaphochlamys debaryana]|eukprot:KAG2491168.1 hypothetical protein HYH03_010380 [Edaphochlamys debaryana]